MDEGWIRTVEGLSVTYSRRVTAEDVDSFASLSGDDYEAHTDDDFMKGSPFGRRIAHGALLVGYMSAAGTRAIRASQALGNDTVPVSLGYDHMRFVAPVFLGDTVTVRYRVKSVDRERRRSVADIEIANQSGVVVSVSEHIMKWLQPDAK